MEASARLWCLAQFQHSCFFYFSWQQLSPLQWQWDFTAYSTSKKEVNQLAAMCDKQSPCMSVGSVIITIIVQLIG